MTAALDHRSQIEAIWAERLVYADQLNAERLAAWMARQGVFFERDMPISVPRIPKARVEPVAAPVVQPAANVRELRTVSRR